MILRRALCVGVLAFSAPAMARQDATQAPRKTSPGQSLIDKQPARPLAEPALGEPERVRPDGLLAPTRPRKQPFVNRIPADHTGALLFKCIDESDARALPDGTIASLSNRNIADVAAIIAKYGLTCRRAINHSDEALAALEARAVAYSGKAQPKLATIMYLEGGDAATLLRALQELKASGNVDWAEWETKRYPTGGLNGACCLPNLTCQDDTTPALCEGILGGVWNGAGSTCFMSECPGACCIDADGICLDFIPRARCETPPPQGFGGVFQGSFTQCPPAGNVDCAFTGACCVGIGDCIDGLTEQECLAQENGIWAGPNVLCEDPDGGGMLDCDIDCGNELAGNCFIPGGNGSPFCDDVDCCGLVCEIDSFCCDEAVGAWDDFCAASANLICDTPGDPCASPINGSCSEPHPAPGCNDEQCCNDVCAIDPFCCDLVFGEWDQGCVNLATTVCMEDPDPDGTPDFEGLQGYRTPGGYGGPSLLGFGGEGWFLEDRFDPHGGLYGLGQELFDQGVDSFGEGVLTRGKTIKVAVIEWGYWVDHEDLDVILEPGQTMFTNPAIAFNNHGTACLSIINALDDGKGMTGVAPEAQAYFFPLTSVEEGPRFATAWTSALMTLDPGDVISASYGPGPVVGNLNNDPADWTFIRLASDLGITCCIAAGNACFNLDGAPDQGDSGGMVVGACSPGFPWYRLAFSNYCTAPGPVILPTLEIERGNIVHVKAWGTAVASDGYGFLYNGDPTPNRSYRATFGGTSAAAPQIAGLVACLQGLAKQFYGIPLTPLQIRAALGAPGGVPIDPPRLFGGFPGPGCSLDFDPDLGPHMIGPYPGAFGTATTILNQSFVGFDDSPLVTGIKILRGRLIFGNHFSIKGSDNNYLVIAGVPTVPTSPPQVPSESGVNPSYGFGLVTDVEVTAHAEVSFTDAIAVAVESHTTSDQALMFVELFDWKSRRWTFIGFSIPVVVDTTVVATALGDPSRFIRKSNKKVLIRVWTIALGFSGGGPAGGGSVRHIMHHDLIDLTVGQDFGFHPPDF